MREDLSPIVNGLNAAFWEGARAGRLMLPRCAATGRAFWPPSPVSPFSAHSAIEWREVEARGVVRAVAVYRRVFIKAFEALAPYGVALVEVQDGVRLLAHMRSPDAADAVRAGERAILAFEPLLPGSAPALIARRTDD